jgi:processive 1,2-diacylglycerol beta-glucosyltransferase
MERKKIFIIYAHAGEGHKKAAEAVFESAKERFPSSEIRLVDVLDYARPYFKDSYTRGYLVLIRYGAPLWGFFYRFFDCGFLYRACIKAMRRVINHAQVRGFEGFIIEERPDMVITAHFLPNEIISFLKSARGCTTKLITCVTDFRPHYFWIADEVDAYMVAHRDTKRELIARGVDEKKIFVTGIPIAQKFFASKDRQAIKTRYGLPDEKKLVLIIGGGFGVGPLEALFEKFKHKTSCEVVIVAGRNEALAATLEKKVAQQRIAHVHIRGFIDTMDEYMYASDAIISKPGGLTLQEALVMRKPVVGIKPVPGQEKRNVVFLSKRGLCLFARTLSGAVSYAERLLGDEDFAQGFTRRITEEFQGKSTGDILDILQKEYFSAQ